MAQRPILRDKVASVLEDVAEEHGYTRTDEAITHVLREAGYDV